MKDELHNPDIDTPEGKERLRKIWDDLQKSVVISRLVKPIIFGIGGEIPKDEPTTSQKNPNA